MRRRSGWMIVAFAAGLVWALRRPRELPEVRGTSVPTPGPTPHPGPPPATSSAATSASGAQPAPEAMAAWVDPNDDGSCPVSHPVKLKASSGIFHVEGQRNYERTKADRCYRTTADAEADGHRPSKI